MGPYWVDAVSAATGETTTPAKPSPAPVVTPAPAPAPVVVKTVPVTIGKAEYAAHGTKCFTLAAAAMSENKIVGSIIDDYQVMDKATSVGVPNSDVYFGKNFAEGKVLGSKLANAAQYSKNMAEKAKATTPVDESLAAIRKFISGKTGSEILKKLATTTKVGMVDAVSGATLVDTQGYLSAIVTAVKSIEPTVETIDAVSTASITYKADQFEKSLGKTGPWIICALKDLTYDKPLVLDGDTYNTKVPPVVARKIALYTQDENHKTTASFTLTAPKLTIKSNYANISKGTFKGDLYVAGSNFKLVEAKVDGNVYFTTQAAKDTFTMDAKSSITGKQILADVDTVASASLVRDVASFEKAIGKNGTWIVCPLNDLTTDKNLVVEGTFRDKNDPTKDLKRKVGLYTHLVPGNSKIVTHRFTLTAPSLTIKSPSATLQHGIYAGDIYVEADKFSLVDQKVTGNIYFATQAALDSFVMDEASSVTGVKAVKTK